MVSLSSTPPPPDASGGRRRWPTSSSDGWRRHRHRASWSTGWRHWPVAGVRTRPWRSSPGRARACSRPARSPTGGRRGPSVRGSWKASVRSPSACWSCAATSCACSRRRAGRARWRVRSIRSTSSTAPSRSPPAPPPGGWRVGLAAVRQDLGLTQAQLAERGRRHPQCDLPGRSGSRGLSVDTLIALADRLGVTLDRLVSAQPSAGYQLARHDRRPTRLPGGVIPWPTMLPSACAPTLLCSTAVIEAWLPSRTAASSWSPPCVGWCRWRRAMIRPPVACR